MGRQLRSSRVDRYRHSRRRDDSEVLAAIEQLRLMVANGCLSGFGTVRVTTCWPSSNWSAPITRPLRSTANSLTFLVPALVRRKSRFVCAIPFQRPILVEVLFPDTANTPARTPNPRRRKLSHGTETKSLLAG